jgi:hypothetical protein
MHSLEKQKYGHGSRRDPKRRLTVLARTSSNLPDPTNEFTEIISVNRGWAANQNFEGLLSINRVDMGKRTVQSDSPTPSPDAPIRFKHCIDWMTLSFSLELFLTSTLMMETDEVSEPSVLAQPWGSWPPKKVFMYNKLLFTMYARSTVRTRVRHKQSVT